MANSIRSANGRKSANGKPKKPYEDFPLFPHATGRWPKKIRGKLHYFGNWAELEGYGWKQALDLYQEQKDDLQAGRKPRKNGNGLTVRNLCNRFLTSKLHQLNLSS